MIAERAAVSARQGVADREAEAGSFRLRGEERIEQPLQGRRREARAVVQNGDLDITIGSETGSHDQLARRRARLDGRLEAVADQIQDRVLDLYGIDRGGRQPLGELESHLGAMYAAIRQNNVADGCDRGVDIR